MNRVVILFMVFLIGAAFSKVEGTFFYLHFFPLAPRLADIWPGYLSVNCYYAGVVGLSWVIYSQEKECIKEVSLAAWLMTGRWIDYLLEGNTGHRINSYMVSYDTFAFIIFGVATIMASKRWISSHLA